MYIQKALGHRPSRSYCFSKGKMSEMRPPTEVFLSEEYPTLENCELAERRTSISDVKSVYLWIPHSVVMTVAIEPVETRAFVSSMSWHPAEPRGCAYRACSVSARSMERPLEGYFLGGQAVGRRLTLRNNMCQGTATGIMKQHEPIKRYPA